MTERSHTPRVATGESPARANRYEPLRLRPVTLTEAKRMVGTKHRHNVPPVTWKFGVGVENEAGELVGVAMAGLPKARMLMDGVTLEVNRTCTDGTPNVNSMLYGAITRAAFALGYTRLVTYTLESESGVSLRAAGWKVDAELPARPDDLWEDHPRNARPQTDLFGNERIPTGAKVRWIRKAAAGRQTVKPGEAAAS